MAKWFNVDDRHRMTVYLEVRNLFDHDNYRAINPWTGQGFHRGNWDGNIASQRANGSQRSVNTESYVEDFVNPSYRTDPRMFLVGVNYRW